MPKKNPLINGARQPFNDEVVVSQDNKSLRKGRRVAPRTEVCRAVHVWREEAPNERYEGVVLDLNPHGLRVRMLDAFAPGSLLMVQMMRDEEFQVALSHPIPVQVVRVIPQTGFNDHGLRLIKRRIYKPAEFRPVPGSLRNVLQRPGSRMHTLDITLDDTGARRTGRNRG